MSQIIVDSITWYPTSYDANEVNGGELGKLCRLGSQLGFNYNRKILNLVQGS